RYLVHLSRERFQTVSNLLSRQTQRPASRSGGQNVFDLEPDPTVVGQRDSIERQQCEFVLAFGQGDRMIANKRDPPVLSPSLSNQRMATTFGEEHRRPWAATGHFG